jgi:hypothetical protein
MNTTWQVFFFSHTFFPPWMDVSAGWGVNKGFALLLEDITQYFNIK